MMARTDRHFRFLMRLLSREALVYTEMVTTNAVLFGDREQLLGYSPEEHPIALQLGGDDPARLAECARIAEGLGYDEVNLNVGCPSDRVQLGNFGACLMAQPELVAGCVAAMREAVAIPVTVKHRIGIDDLDSYEHLRAFVDTVAAAGADRFTVHARKAWLKGLSPRQNREIPPLRYADVHRLKAERPDLLIEINGGLRTHDAIGQHLGPVDGVMIGRAAYEDPYLLAEVDQRYFGATAPPPTRLEVVERLLPYLARQEAQGTKWNAVTRHMLPLFLGQPGTRAFKRALSRPNPGRSGGEVVREALRAVGGADPRPVRCEGGAALW
jgi:tRNA-dihydrouridine synthase A